MIFARLEVWEQFLVAIILLLQNIIHAFLSGSISTQLECCENTSKIGKSRRTIDCIIELIRNTIFLQTAENKLSNSDMVSQSHMPDLSNRYGSAPTLIQIPDCI